MTRKKVSAPVDFDAECGRPLGPNRGECLLPAGHKDPWCQDAIALHAKEYLEMCRDYLEVKNLEKLREFFALCWILGCPVSDMRPDLMNLDTVRREAWWLIWSGGVSA